MQKEHSRIDPELKREFGVALVADDAKRDALVEVLREFVPMLKQCKVYATRITGMICSQRLGLDIHMLESSVKGGDQQIGALVTEGKVDAVIYFRDPLLAPPYSPDIAPLLRVCDIYNVPMATNIASAWTTLYGIALCLPPSTNGAQPTLRTPWMARDASN